MKGSLLVVVLVAASSLELRGQAVSSPGHDKPADVANVTLDHGRDPSGYEVLDKPRVHDFAPYTDAILTTVREHWYPLISELRAASYEKSGTTVVEFVIKKDGILDKVRVAKPSGDERLDVTALSAIRQAAPFKPLPAEFKMKSMGFLFHLGYNQPIVGDPCPVLQPGVYRVKDGIKIPHALFAPDPEYSEEARQVAYEGTVLLGLIVDADGSVRDLCVLQASGEGLDKQSLDAVKTWRFEPAIKDGSAVPVRLTVETTFHHY
jgi:TonB family protein